MINGLRESKKELKICSRRFIKDIKQTIELSEEIHALIESDPFLKLVVERIIREDVVSYVLSVLIMDKLTEDSKLTEEEIMEIDEEIKKEIRRRIEDEINRWYQ